jgi:ribosomal protein S18 acetylase RimI-like enzyme
VPEIADREWIQERLARDPAWTAYALADLEPGYVENTAWFRDANGQGLTLLYRGYSTPLVFCIEDSACRNSILDEIDKILGDSGRYLVVRPEGAPLIRSRYGIREERPTLRMALDAGQRLRAPGLGEIPLGPEHLHAVHELYREEPPEFFLDRMLAEGVYFGIFEGPRLAAVAGTHLLSRQYQVGAVGNVYTRPDRRSRGYGSCVASAVSARLLEMGIGTIVLNVREENQAAIRLYHRLGYAVHCRFIEAIV